jgi:hypothetical protein
MEEGRKKLVNKSPTVNSQQLTLSSFRQIGTEQLRFPQGWKAQYYEQQSAAASERSKHTHYYAQSQSYSKPFN